MRRAVEVLVVLTVVASVVILAGCGGGNGAPDGATMDTAKKPPPEPPPPPPPPGKLVCWKFTDWGDRTTDLLTMNGDGSDVQLLGVEGGGSYPSWSPDGTRICFTGRGSAGPEALPAIYTVAADGSDQQQFTIGAEGDVPDGSDFYAAWSPNGDEIAFVRSTGTHDTPGGGAEETICVKGWPNGTLRQLTSGQSDNNPAWSPDGEFIAFVRYPDGLMVMPADGSAPPQPIDEEPLLAYGSSWGPLGIAWGNGGIFYVPVAFEDEQWQVDGDVTQLTDDVHHCHATWSPDGTAIAFQYETWKKKQGVTFHTCVVYLDGGVVQEIGQGANPDWWAPESP